MINCRSVKILFSLALCYPLTAISVELEQLWVPKSYLRHLPRLYDAAQLVENSSRCHQFIEGAMALDHSSLEHPVFQFRCRDSERQTYGILVDGPSLEKLDDTRPGGRVSFAQLEQEYQQELERQRERERKLEELAALEEQKRQEAEALAELEEQRKQEALERQRRLEWWAEEQKRRAQLWQLCRAALEDRVGRMAALEWLTRAMPAQELSDDLETGAEPALMFEFEFNAQDPYGKALYYRAQCSISSPEDLQLSIKPRRDSGLKESLKENSAPNTATESAQEP